MTDLLVIGAGLSGLMAAYTAAQAGQKVTVIAKGLGSIHWTPATLDLFGYAPDRSPISRPLEMIDRVAQTTPSHPYALLGRDQSVVGVESFRLLMAELGLAYVGAATRRRQSVPALSRRVRHGPPSWLPKPRPTATSAAPNPC